MNDVGFVKTVLDLTCLGFLDRLCDVGSNGTCLGVRHKTARTEDSTETAYQTHAVGSGDEHVEVHPVFLLDLPGHVLSAYEVSACFLCKLLVGAFADSENANVLTSTVGKYNRAANLLVCVTAVNAELYVKLNGFVKLGYGSLDDCIESLVSII